MNWQSPTCSQYFGRPSPPQKRIANAIGTTFANIAMFFGQKKPGTRPGFRKFGRGCLKGLLYVPKFTNLRKCEKPSIGCTFCIRCTHGWNPMIYPQYINNLTDYLYPPPAKPIRMGARAATPAHCRKN
jgi:hypothetical protein